MRRASDLREDTRGARSKVQHDDLVVLASHYRRAVRQLHKQRKWFLITFGTASALDAVALAYVWRAGGLQGQLSTSVAAASVLITMWILLVCLSGTFLAAIHGPETYVRQCNQVLKIYHLEYCVEAEALVTLHA